MASLRSLGVHKPSALSYLVAESILSEDATEEHYTWETFNDDESEDYGEEEVVTTDYYVVWSRGGVVRKVFNFEVEEEKVVQAILTWFPSDEAPMSGTRVQKGTINGGNEKLRTSLTQGTQPATNPNDTSHYASSQGSAECRSRALVVLLKSQAHVFFLSGSTHIVSLPFEVERAFPAPRGLILQRKIPQSEIVSPTPVLPPAPQNSFLSSQSFSQPHRRFGSSFTTMRQTKALKPGTVNALFLKDLIKNSTSSAMDGLPRLFSFTDPLSELGLVVNVVSSPERSSLLAINSSGHRRLEPVEKTEELVYVSAQNEVCFDRESGDKPLILVVTANYETNFYTIWTASYIELKSMSSVGRRRQSTLPVSKVRRRSSYGPTAPGTGATTPALRARDGMRESFGGLARSKTVPASFNVSTNQNKDKASDQTAEDALASQLDPDFDLSRQPKESRRVSSLLSRAELSTSFDRSAFQDLATHRTSIGASFGANSRRGPSFGGYADRNSFGGPSQIRNRVSTPGSISRLSFGGASIDDTLEDIMDEDSYDTLDDYDELNDMFAGGGYGGAFEQGPMNGLRKELVMSKIAEIPIGDHRSKASALTHNGTDFAKDCLRIFTLPAPCNSGAIHERRLFVHIVNGKTQSHIECEFSVLRKRSPTPAFISRPHGKDVVPRHALVPTLLKSQRLPKNVDALKISDRGIERVLCLSRDESGESVISLYTGWGQHLPMRFALGPLKLFNPYKIESDSPSSRKSAGQKRTLSAPRDLQKLLSPGLGGTFDVLDGECCRHRLQLQLAPRTVPVSKAFEICLAVLPNNVGDLLIGIWWSVCKSLLKNQVLNVEWTALVVSLFSLAAPFIDQSSVKLTDTNKPSQKATNSRQTTSQAKATKPSYPSAWDTMWNHEATRPIAKSWEAASWSWIRQSKPLSPLMIPPKPCSSTRCSSDSEIIPKQLRGKSDFIPFCASFARKFTQSPIGKAANDHWRRISAPENQDMRCFYLPKLLVALHLLREERKLEILSQDYSTTDVGNFTPVLAQLGHWIQWDSWNWSRGDYYDLDGGGVDQWIFEECTSTLEYLGPSASGHDKYSLGFLVLHISSQSLSLFLTMLDVGEWKLSRIAIMKADVISAPWETPPSIFEWLNSAVHPELSPQFPTLALLMRQPKSSPHPQPDIEQYVSTITPRTIALGKYLRNVRSNSDSSVKAVEFMARSNISIRMLETLPEAAMAPLREAIVRCQASPPTTWTSSLLKLVQREDLDLHSTFLAESMLDMQQASTNIIGVQSNLPSGTRDVHSVCQTTEQPEPLQSAAEVERHLITRLIFSEDRRFFEAYKLLEPLKQAVAECIPDSRSEEAAVLDAQKNLMQWVMVRTFSLPSGSAMIKYNSKKPLLTEKYPLYGFTTSCLMKPMNNVVTADRSNYTEEKFGWAFFHAGVAAGLSISREAQGIDTSWIMYNKPAELTNKHAGLLLGLGLNGHLKTIAKWLSFKYLTPKHTMTSVGLLLGLSASYLGTMDTLVTRLLSVHVTRMLPPGAAELNLSPYTETTGLMGIGLLYYNTQHRRMSEIMLSEIEHIDHPDPSECPDTLRDEGYRLAAGFALGFINLGKGRDLRGLHDMRLVERLLAVAVGPKPVDVVHILDQATAGAVIAIALIFMKTHDEAVARKVDIPDTLPQFDYVRPDIFLLRTLAKHLIMWDSIRAEYRWIVKNLPPEHRNDYQLKNIKVLRSEYMPFFNIIAGLLWSISLKYAGSGDTKVRDFLVKYLDQFMRIYRLPALRYDAKLARNAVRNCQDLVALASATVMAGTGDLDVFRRLRSLHGRVGPDTPYGSHVADHMAFGALFIAGGTHTFSTSNKAIASLICAFYPLFPMDVQDNKAHLQAFRHFWVLAAEPRCLVIRDVDTHRAVSVPIAVRLKNGSEKALVAPCLVPELDTIASIKTTNPEYWEATLDFTNNLFHLACFKVNQTMRVRRRSAHDMHSSTFSTILVALNDAQAARTARIMWDWLFALPALNEFEKADVGFIIPLDPNSSVHTDMSGTVVDERLVLRAQARSWRRDDLWNLRVLFEWAERAQESSGNLRWLGREVVERLRAVVLERGRGIGGVN